MVRFHIKQRGRSEGGEAAAFAHCLFTTPLSLQDDAALPSTSRGPPPPPPRASASAPASPARGGAPRRAGPPHPPSAAAELASWHASAAAALDAAAAVGVATREEVAAEVGSGRRLLEAARAARAGRKRGEGLAAGWAVVS